MDPLTKWGIDFISNFQAMGGEGLARVFEAITFLGNQEFYLLLLPLIFWTIDRKLGLRLIFIYLLSVYVNTGLKEIIQAPRPIDVDRGLLLSGDEEAIYAVGYGMPSGHSQWAVSIWAAAAYWLRKRWLWALAAVVAFLVGLSRVYLGAHFPLQVVAGWGTGLLFLAVYLVLYLPVETWLSRLSLSRQLLLAVAAPIVMVVLLPVPDSVAAAAVIMGAGIGLALARPLLGYQKAGGMAQRAISYLLGVVVLLAIYFGLSLIFPSEGASLYVFFRFLRYALLGLWITLGAPALFRFLHLSSPSPLEAA